MKKELTKEQRIKKEISRLSRIFKDIKDEKKIRTAQPLIERAAFLRITLEDYENDLNTNGSVELFQQSDKQEPYERERPVARLYNSANTQYTKILKQLTDLLPDIEHTEEDGLIDYIQIGRAKI